MTMFLTRVVIPRQDVLLYQLGDRYAWHRKIWEAFPGTPKGTSDLFQWRIDRKETMTILWILSTKHPDFQSWKRLKTTDFYEEFRSETKEVAESFLSHRRYVFSLCANPTVKKVVRLPDKTRKKNGRRLAITGEESLKKWLQCKGESAGFVLEQTRITRSVKEYFSKGWKKDWGIHYSVEFTGILNVVDSEKFSTAFKTGIGSAKGFGFGLLLLKPIE